MPIRRRLNRLLPWRQASCLAYLWKERPGSSFPPPRSWKTKRSGACQVTRPSRASPWVGERISSPVSSS